MTEPELLHPALWREGDRIPHPIKGARHGGWVTIVGVRVNKARNASWIKWQAADGETGRTRFTQRWVVLRASET